MGKIKCIHNPLLGVAALWKLAEKFVKLIDEMYMRSERKFGTKLNNFLF
jgi:hypothetical protein